MPDDSKRAVSMRRHIIVSGDDALATTIVEELNSAGVHIVKLATARARHRRRRPRARRHLRRG